MRLDFAPLFRSTVGYDRLLDLLDSASETAQGYPPYNIERIEENRYRITIAVAGFGEKDLSAEVRDGGRPRHRPFAHRGRAHARVPHR